MNRRHFIKSIPALVLCVPAISTAMAVTPVKTPKIPSSILLIWSHKNGALGTSTWNTPTEADYWKALQEAISQHALMAYRGYDVKYQEFDVLEFNKKP